MSTVCLQSSRCSEMCSSYKARPKAMHQWMTGELERLAKHFARLKPSGCGYNRIQPILISRSVTHMLNNPLPHPLDSTQRASMCSASVRRSKGVLRRSDAEFEEAYPTLRFQRSQYNKECARQAGEDSPKFTFYRNCSTRLT